VNYLSDALLQILRAGNRSTGYAVLSVAKTLVGTAFSVWFVAGPKLGAWGILAGAVLGNLIVTPFGLWMTSRQGSLSPRFVRKDVLGQFASYGLPLVPAAMSSWALVLADRYVIGGLRGAAEVGLYSTAYTLGDKIMNLIIMPLMITMGPVMVMTFEKNGQALAQQVQTQFTRYYAMVTFPIIAGMAAVTYQFFQVFVGPSYREAYPVLPIVMVGVMGYGLVQIAANGVALHKRSTIIMTNTIAAAAVNVASNLYFVPRFGYMAAAYNTVLAYFVLLGLTWYRSRPYMAWQLPWKNLGRITLSSVLMGVLVWLAFHTFAGTAMLLVAEVATGVAMYAVALVVLREIEPAERQFLADLGGRVLVRLRLRRP
jgi:O-antigen/teichoic acid export membrane protein